MARDERKTNGPTSPVSTTGMTYRGEDGRVHMTPEQEEAARGAEQGDRKPDSVIDGLTRLPPD
jgi:hypothetical protein